ncbi:MAG TPA: septal ring lytic transglycosylase RlpA family protein [Stenotrophomonas sp.]|nr:septal ring lytic transglycosylase RlpA family protein [Stenotrophomonas sp.]
MNTQRTRTHHTWWLPVLLVAGLAACSSAPKKGPSTAGAVKGVKVEGKGPAHVATGCPSTSPYAPAKEDPSTRGDYTAGGLYRPGVKDTTPDYVPNVACIPEPLVSNEPHSAIGNRSPYQVLGKTYKVMDDAGGYVETGTASYYGNKFHGRLTSNKEVYDMYAFTAAHKTLPLPSFALVTNLDTGDSVVVRVNDRGPFHDGRVIDLSYAAAVKLGITQRGTGRVEVRGLTGADNAGLLARRNAGGKTMARPATSVAAAAPAKAAESSRIDELVKRLPEGTGGAGKTTSQASPAAAVATVARATTATSDGERWRYRVADAPQPGNADNFDAWMKAKGVRVATGKPTAVAAEDRGRDGSRAATPTIGAATVVPAAVGSAVVRKVAESAPLARASSPSALGPVQLQVASFASRENASRALSQLSTAGIPGASISDGISGGRTLWRLRVNAPDHASASELAARIAGLGFARPQIVAN